VEVWRNSVFVRETPLRGTPWTLVLETPLKRHHNLLNETYYSNLLLVLILLVATLLMASVLSRILTLPLSRLAQETTGLPSRVLRGDESQSFLQPRNPLLEIETLISNFQAMAGTLQQNFAELRGTQRQLEIEQQRLTEANRLKDEFLAILSHELRTPLVPIIGYADLIARGILKDEERDEGARSIERNARAQLRLIEDLLDVSRIITGKLSLQVGKVNLSQVMSDCIETVSLSAHNKDITLEYNEHDKIAAILGDEARVRQVVWNLLSNAVKFTPHNGRIEVGLRRVDEEAEITVSDSGQGIAPDFLPHVFDRFRQGSDHLTRSAGGLGLGLAIVQHLVDLHGGTVTVHSEGEGQGTTFRVRLPVRSHPDAPLDEPSANGTSDGSNEKPAERGASAKRTAPGLLAHSERIASTQAVPASATERAGHTEHESNGAAPPAAPPDVPRPRAMARNTLVMRHRLPGAKILVIDDEADGRELLMATLRLEGATVRGAGSAQEALQLTKQETPDAVVCDIGMPTMDGYEFLRTLRSDGNFERVPVIAFTAFASKADRDQMLASGFDAYLSKPAMSDEVIDVLERMVERH
jgi:signal transduction histidine kinase/CheY-like chemotaxis protein